MRHAIFKLFCTRNVLSRRLHWGVGNLTCCVTDTDILKAILHATYRDDQLAQVSKCAVLTQTNTTLYTVVGKGNQFFVKTFLVLFHTMTAHFLKLCRKMKIKGTRSTPQKIFLQLSRQIAVFHTILTAYRF